MLQSQKQKARTSSSPGLRGLRSREGYHPRDSGRTDPDGRCLAHPVLIANDWRQSDPQAEDEAVVSRFAPRSYESTIENVICTASQWKLRLDFKQSCDARDRGF